MSKEGDDLVPENRSNEEKSGKEFEAMFRSLELKAQRGLSLNQGLDLSQFTREQVDRLIGLAEKNEQNASNYFNNKAQTRKDITIRQIEASIVNQKTFRYSIFGILFVVLAITGGILALKPDYFGQWLHLLAGLAGGFGLGKIKALRNKKTKSDDEVEGD